MSKILDLFVANPQWLLGQDKEDEEEQLKDILKKATPKLKSIVKTGQEQQQYFFKFNRTGFLKTNLQGLPAGFLVEVSGEAGAGKTCFALETAAAALLNDEKSHVLFISSEGKFPAERLLQIIGNDCNSYSDRVLVEETEYLENFLTLVQKLPNVCKKYEDSGHKIACIIVDSITALMRLEYEAKDSMARGDMLDSLCSDLKEIATRFKLPVLFINQVSENIDEPMIHWAHRPMSKKPSLGITWRYLMDECIFLSIEKNEKEEKERVLEITKSQRMKTVPLKFKITKNGFEEAMDSAGVRKNINGVHPRIPISYDLYKQLKTEASSEMQEGNISCSKFIPLPSTVGKCRLAFMGRSSNPGASPDPNLMFVDVDPLLRNVDLSNWSDLIKPLRIDDRMKQRSVQHDLLLERKRQSPSKGVNDFSFTGNRLLMQGGKSSIFYADIGEIPKFVTHEVPALDNAAPRMDPKLCPGDVNYMAFYRNGNLWLQNIEKVGEIVQLTNAGQEDVDFKGVYAGWVNYLIQEEFDRYSGYYWQDTASRTQRIVYEVSDESELETLTYVNHVAVAQQICTAGGASSGNARSAASSEAVFPSSGSKNPKTDIRFLTVCLPDNETDKVTVRRFKLPIPLMEYLPWSETEKQGYVVRYGWIGDNGIWAHVLTRLQNKSAIVFIPINSFVNEESELPDNFINQHPVFILHQWTSETWIKETDSIHFFDLKVAENGEEGKLDFIFHFENMSGFEHLFYLTALLNWNADRIPDLQFNSTIMCETMIRPITTGNWQVQNTGIDIDFANQLVYFQGMRDSPLETHLYRVNYQKGNAHDESCLRLTKSNFNHFDISVFIDENMFLVKSSNVNTPTSIEIYRIPKPETAIFWTEEGVCPRPLAFLADDVTQTQQPKPEKLAKRESRGPEIFSFKNSSGDEIFGQIYKPENFDSKNKYPTIVYVYGGPRVQNIRNQFSASRSDRHRMYSKFGYVILTFDNRGSDNRGLKFEGVIKDHMGYYEVQDQVEGIAYVAQNMGFIDVNRVAIEGWSYGGFMSLMAIAQYPDVFKIAISGAPVVDWRLYDSAYTERYLGLPQDNPKAYSDSSVVQQVPNLPDEPNRLLLFHGMIDENVITTNMMVLIEKLTRACKPYDLKLFVQERHSMRSSKTVEYYEMTVLTYLNQFL